MNIHAEAAIGALNDALDANDLFLADKITIDAIGQALTVGQIVLSSADQPGLSLAMSSIGIPISIRNFLNKISNGELSSGDVADLAAAIATRFGANPIGYGFATCAVV